MNNEFETMRDEVIVAYFKVLALFLEGPKKKTTNRSQDSLCVAAIKSVISRTELISVAA
jgi:hypothetical protein